MEEQFRCEKDCFGLDESGVRLYTAIVRHTVLVVAAAAICAITAALRKPGTGAQEIGTVRSDTTCPRPFAKTAKPLPDLRLGPVFAHEIGCEW